MFKTGIYKIDQLKNPKKLKTIFGKDKRISITLYHELLNDPHGSDLMESILMQFTDDRGAFKRTYSKRFEEFDQHALDIIKSHFSQSCMLKVHDVAVSDGRTACDFFEKLSPHFPQLEYYASDYDPHIYLIESGRIKVIVNKTGTVLEVVCPPFVLQSTKDSLFYIVNHLTRFILNKVFIKKIIEKRKESSDKCQDLLLFCPKALTLAYQDSRFQLMQYDLFKSSLFLPQSTNLLRAMNILNLGYFSPEEFRIIIDNIYQSLSPNGLLITGSNQGPNTVVHGGIFQKTPNGFKSIWQSGTGSQVAAYLINFSTNHQTLTLNP